MTAVTASPAGPQRIAAIRAACGAPGCTHQIEPGQKIAKPPGRAWRHLDCGAPWAGWAARRRSGLAGTGALPGRSTR